MKVIAQSFCDRLSGKTRSDDQARDDSTTRGWIRPTVMACRPYSLEVADRPAPALRPDTTVAWLAMPVRQ